MSGFLPDHPLVHADARSVADTRFYWAHGRADPAIPFAMAVEGRASLRRAGADLVTVDEPGGHWIERSTVDALVAWASSPSRS
jgi:predicted esterase